MEFLVDFNITVPEGTPEPLIQHAETAEAAAADELVLHGHLVRLWKRAATNGETRAVGIYRASSRPQLDGLLSALPLADWMTTSVTPLEPHPNDPVAGCQTQPIANPALPSPQLTLVDRLEAALSVPLDLGDTAQGHRRIAPLTGGTFSGPNLNGKLLPGASADWQVILSDGTVLGDIRYTLLSDRGDVLYVQSRGVRHGSPEVLARLGRGENVDASEYTFRTWTQIETAAPDLDWLNKGVFISVGGRTSGVVIYEIYLVG
jgi:muconolactone delta-isomerase